MISKRQKRLKEPPSPLSRGSMCDFWKKGGPRVLHFTHHHISLFPFLSLFPPS